MFYHYSQGQPVDRLGSDFDLLTKTAAKATHGRVTETHLDHHPSFPSWKWKNGYVPPPVVLYLSNTNIFHGPGLIGERVQPLRQIFESNCTWNSGVLHRLLSSQIRLSPPKKNNMVHFLGVLRCDIFPPSSAHQPLQPSVLATSLPASLASRLIRLESLDSWSHRLLGGSSQLVSSS